MQTKCVRENRFLRLWSGAVVLAVSALCVGVSLAGAPSQYSRVAVLTPGLAFNLALEGFREELA